jgi:hypothetical protein
MPAPTSAPAAASVARERLRTWAIASATPAVRNVTASDE